MWLYTIFVLLRGCCYAYHVKQHIALLLQGVYFIKYTHVKQQRQIIIKITTKKSDSSIVCVYTIINRHSTV